MAASFSVPGPFAGQPDGFCESAGGVLNTGHVMTVSTAYFARERLIDPQAAKEDRRQAFLCLDTVIRDQIADTARGEHSYGLNPFGCWYWSVGNSLKRKVSFNFEHFIGSSFLQILLHDAVPDHSDWPAGLLERLRQSVIDAAVCSVNRRVRVSYTNPMAMGIECEALAGEMFARPDFLENARRRLSEWVEFTERAGTFEEYNSSCYGGVTLPHTAMLVEHVRDSDIRRRALYMERKYFDHVCDFYHHPTGELNMPQARSYHRRFAGTHLREYLCQALWRLRPGAFEPPPSPRPWDPSYCCHATSRQVDRLLARFPRAKEVRVFSEWIGCDHVGPLHQVPPPAQGPPARRRELVNWRTGQFCLGSVSEIDSWQQRRSIGGFIKVPGGAVMVSWTPSVTVAGADEDEQDRRWPTMMYFNLAAGQVGSTVLAGLGGTPVDDGWLCGSHWRQKVAGAVSGVSVDFGFDVDLPSGPTDEAVVQAVAAAMRVPPVAGQPWRMRLGKHVVSLLLMGGHLGAAQAQPEIVKTDFGWRVVLMRLTDFALNWSNPPEVGLAFVLDISPVPAPAIADFRWQVRGTRLDCQATVGRRRLTLAYDPPGIKTLTSQARQFDVEAVK